MKLCGKDECIHKAMQSMVDKMKGDVAERQNIAYNEQIVVAQIYDINAAILAEACRRNLKVKKGNCEPSKQFKLKHLTLDTFILLNQLKEDGFITEEHKQIIFDALVKIKPGIKKLIEEDRTRGLI